METAPQTIIRFPSDLRIFRPTTGIRLWNKALNVESGQIILDFSGVYFLRPFAAALAAGITFLARDRGVEVTVISPPQERENVLHQFHYLGLDDLFALKIEMGRHVVPAIPIRRLHLGDYSPADEGVDLLGRWIHLSPAVKKLTHVGIKETIDNVYTHAGKGNLGLLAANVIRTRKRIRLLILDTGPGIRATLARRDEYSHLASDGKAIELATDKRVTGLFEQDRGWGLYVLRELIRSNRGEMVILSGRGCVVFRREGTVRKELGATFLGTVVHLELRIDDRYYFTFEDLISEAEIIF